MQILALIPARGGSKSIPRKNIKMIAGAPLISYTIKSALESKRINRVIVSTDDKEIAAISESYGAEVPFLRPSDISGDLSTDIEFHRHALDWLKTNENYMPDMVINLRPTHPIRRPETIDAAIEKFSSRPGADSLRSIRKSDLSPFKMWTINSREEMEPVAALPNVQEPYNEPRQKLPMAFWQDGYIDITLPKTILEKNSTTGDTIIPFVIEEVCVDIDYQDEIPKAEKILLSKQDASKPADDEQRWPS